MPPNDPPAYAWEASGEPFREEAHSAPASPALRAGSRLGPFEVVGVLGKGGMGVVYRARQPGADRDVALKVVAGEVSASRLDRFAREGQITAGLDHPHIVRLHSAGDVDGAPYLVYELVDGARTLTQVSPSLSLRQRVLLLRDVARGVGFAHQRGVVHRDLKPDNVLIDADGRVRVADFGLATAVGLERLTQSGAVLGTPLYMAPEQAFPDFAEVSAATDVWALGVLLYEVLCGRVPFLGTSLLDLARMLVHEDPPPPRSLAPDLPRALESICLKALRREPSQRYANGDALADDLDAYLEDRPITASTDAWEHMFERLRPRSLPAWFLALVILLLLGSGVAAWLGWSGVPPAAPPDTQAPLLRLTTPTVDAEVLEGVVKIAGSVEDPSTPIAIHVGESLGVQVASGSAFTIDVRLEEGENRIAVVAVDAANNRAPAVSWTLTYRPTPAWYRALRAEERPALPLPAGVTFCETDGDYLNARDGSVLRWIPPLPTRNQAGYYLGKFEVTQAQYRSFCNRAGHPPPEPGEPVVPDERHPITCVSYVDAQAYCAWAGLRLPTEAEWEWAARGPQNHTYPWGSRPDRSRANLAGPGDPWPTTSPVGEFPAGASTFGCLDMLGNVREWIDVRDSANFVRQVSRGGCFQNEDMKLDRRNMSRTHRNHNLGFRVAR